MRNKTAIEYLLKHGRHFCIVPWVHLHVTTFGNMNLCCEAVGSVVSPGFGSLNKNSFHELWQGRKIRDFRLKMLSDEADPRCAHCYKQNEIGHRSLRIEKNRMYGEYIDWVAGTDETGFAPDAKPVDWDIRFSNVCNLKCRSCGCFSSSGWFKETNTIDMGKELLEMRKKALDPEENGNGALTGVKNHDSLLDDLSPYLPDLKQVLFAGGEPLLMDANYRLLERLNAIGNNDVKLLYITNAARIRYKNYDLFELWKNFKTISINISLDGIEKRCEYLRKGLVWDKALRNIEEIKRRCPQAYLLNNYTVSVFNVLHLPDYHREMIENGYFPEDRIILIFLNDPPYYSARVLPPEMKKQAVEKLKTHTGWLKLRFPSLDLSQWNACIKFINAEDRSDLIPVFLKWTNELDRIRDETCLDVFPELKPVFKGHILEVIR